MTSTMVPAHEVRLGDRIDNWVVYDLSFSPVYTEKVYIHVRMVRPRSTRTRLDMYNRNDTVVVDRLPDDRNIRETRWRAAAGLPRTTELFIETGELWEDDLSETPGF